MKYVKHDSYIHLKAKEVLKEWFDNSHDNDGYHKLGDFHYCPNRKSGCWLEYPICRVDGTSSWDMNWDEIAADDDGYCLVNEYVPTFEECVTKSNSIPIAVIDVVCCHKGRPCYGFEIYHTHRTPLKKIKLLERFGIKNLYEIDAQWILNQISKPEHIKYKTLIDKW